MKRKSYTKKRFSYWLSIIAVGMMSISGCASFNPRPIEEVPFQERAQTKYENNVRVTAAVPSEQESSELFGAHLYKRLIQPVWLEIENSDDEPVWLLPLGVDPDYFTPIESAFMNHFNYVTPVNDAMDRHFYELGTGIYIAPHSVRTGFIFTNLDEGTKEFNVDLAGEDHRIRTFTFFINVPGLRADHHEVDFKNLYPEDVIEEYSETGIREALETIPCSTTNKEGTEQGDPLNIVVIGEGDELFYAFIRAGWDETETVYSTSMWKTAMSFLFGGRYRYSPVSALYVYGRKQDVALQKARQSIHERNHLRLWLSPMRYENKPVWIGQISRDIGVRFTTKTITTHKIDPDVDETRNYLIENFLYSQGLAKFAFVKGACAAPITEPRRNLTGDPYFTDGYRLVLWLSGAPVDIEDIEFIKWDIPPRR